MIDDIHYLNSGDWVESLTCIVESYDQRFEIISYADFCALTGRKPKGATLRAIPVAGRQPAAQLAAAKG
jgi:hypothetical protein